MNYGFRSILIPVDFSINTEVAVKKAIELAEKDTVIHLLYVHNNFLNGLTISSSRQWFTEAAATKSDVTDNKLHQWKTSIEECTGLHVCTWTCYEGGVQQQIEAKAKKLGVDLVVIGKKGHHGRLPFLNTVTPSVVARNTGIPVLTVKPGSIYNKVKKVVVPISSESVDHKIDLIQVLCRKNRMQVHLVTFMHINKPADFHASSLLQVYQRIRNMLHCSVDYAVLHGHNKAKELLKYAERIDADVLIVHSQTETNAGWLNRQISDVLPSTSKVQVFAIAPAV